MYRENIMNIIEETGERISTLVVPKNSGLKGYAWQVLSEAGLNLDDAEEVAENKLKAGGLDLILKRGEDIPQLIMDYASQGEVVLGLTGDDLFDEFRLRNPDNPLRVENTYDWFDQEARYLRPALCLINRTGSIKDMPLDPRIAIGSKYEQTSKKFLEDSPLTQGFNFRQTVYSGDVEITVAEGTNDCCIDMVYSGRTLDENGLKEIEIVRFSDLVVISPLRSEESLFGRVMAREYAQIVDRLQRPTDSYTSEILADPEKLARKGSEEMLELILAVLGIGNGQTIPEAADVMYAFNMLIARGKASLDDVAREIAKRQT